MKKLFSVLGCSLLILAITVSFAFVFKVNGAVAAVGCLAALLFYAKTIHAFYNNQGHGVEEAQSKKKRFWGFTEKQVAYFTVIGLLVAAFAVLAFSANGDLHPRDGNNLRHLAISIAGGYFLSFLVWRFNLYEETFYQSEYDARVRLSHLKFSPEKTEEEIERLKNIGILKR